LAAHAITPRAELPTVKKLVRRVTFLRTDSPHFVQIARGLCGIKQTLTSLDSLYAVGGQNRSRELSEGIRNRGHYMDTRRRRRGGVKTLVEDEELLRLRTMAEGSKPFEASGLWERLASLGLKEIMKLPPRERLGVGYYTAAQRHDNSMKEDAQRRICL
jgi:hypothetical protein